MDVSMSRYVVMHDYGPVEGWKIVGQTESILAAVRMREADIANGGGISEIFEWASTLERYRAADYEDRENVRKAGGIV